MPKICQVTSPDGKGVVHGWVPQGMSNKSYQLWAGTPSEEGLIEVLGTKPWAEARVK